MSEVKDYTSEHGGEPYNGVPSMYGKRVKSQLAMQPKYSMPGESTGEMQGEKRNEQKGP